MITVTATGETPTDDELQDGLQALKFMLRSWSEDDMLVYSITQDTLTMTGASSYTIGSGGDLNTVRPDAIRGAVVDDYYVIEPIGPARYRELKVTDSDIPKYFYYNPVYPLGLLYPYGTGGSSMVIDSLKALTEPAGLTSNVAFAPGYDEAIKYNLAIRLAAEYGKEPSRLVFEFARESKKRLAAKNISNQISAADFSNMPWAYNIDEG